MGYIHPSLLVELCEDDFTTRDDGYGTYVDPYVVCDDMYGVVPVTHEVTHEATPEAMPEAVSTPKAAPPKAPPLASLTPTTEGGANLCRRPRLNPRRRAARRGDAD